MKYLKITLITMLAIFIATTSLQARENLRVGVIFDYGTGHDHIQRPKIADKLITNLNKVFKESGLSSYYNFQLTKTLHVSFSGGKDFNPLKRDYLRKAYSKYNGKYAPMLTLQIYQKAYKFDVIVAISENSDVKLLGSAMKVLKKGNIANCATYGIVFLNNNNGSSSSSLSKALTDKYALAHEIGHTFGINHGSAVAKKTGKSGHYRISNAFAKGANGYGNYDSSNKTNSYTTLMSYKYIPVKSYRANSNRFSDKSKKNCGYYHNKPCGDSNANAVQVLKNNASKYGKRSEWYN